MRKYNGYHDRPGFCSHGFESRRSYERLVIYERLVTMYERLEVTYDRLEVMYERLISMIRHIGFSTVNTDICILRSNLFLQ